jgi:outer membrane protein OmpA-like peptidoglycan-associated protein
MYGKLAICAFSALVAVGCGGTMVNKAQYDRDIQALKDYAESVDRRNKELEAQAAGWRNVEDIKLIATTQEELYRQIAESLKQALSGLHGEAGDLTFDAKSGKWTMGTDLLFDSGSWKITAKGMEILKKFADAHKGKEWRFRVVGHSDRAPIVKKATMDALETDTQMELSVRRSVAVVGALQKFGMTEKQFECVGMGNTQPIAPNDRNVANMKKNRRVEIFILK